MWKGILFPYPSPYRPFYLSFQLYLSDTSSTEFNSSSRASDDEKKMNTLADQLKDAQKMAEDADQKYEDASKRMNQCEAQLEVDGERADLSEFKIIELEEELKVRME